MNINFTLELVSWISGITVSWSGSAVTDSTAVKFGVVVSLGKMGKSLGNSSLVLSVIELVEGTSEVEEIVVEVDEAVVVEVSIISCSQSG